MFLFCYNNIYEVFDIPFYFIDLVDHPHQNAIINLPVRAQRIRTKEDIYCKKLDYRIWGPGWISLKSVGKAVRKDRLAHWT